MSRSHLLLALVSLPLAAACQCGANRSSADAGTARVGLVTDVGGRGDQSFNDSALRGLELWAAGLMVEGASRPATEEERRSSIPEPLRESVTPVAVRPMVLQSKAQEDYEPNLQLLVDQGSAVTVGVGFMLENAVEAVASRNPDAKFVLIDSQLLDPQGHPRELPNVRTVVFREEEGSFLVGALAARVSRTGTIGFVGGMQIALIQRFEAGYRAGAAAVEEGAKAPEVRVGYTGSFDNVSAGKLVAQDLISKGADVLFHAAGSDGLGVIQAVKEARAAGREVWAIGVDSDQWHVAPEVVLTSMVKRVDLAVYEAAKDAANDSFTSGHQTLGLAEKGVAMAEVRVDFENKDAILAQVEALGREIADGKRSVPTTPGAVGQEAAP